MGGAMNTGFMANGNLVPMAFVKLVIGTGKFRLVDQCGANEAAYGFTGMALKFPQGLGGSATLAAEAGDSIEVITPPFTGQLTLGGTVAMSGYVKSDASGFGVAIATTGTTVQQIAGRMIEGGASGDKALCQAWMVPTFVALS